MISFLNYIDKALARFEGWVIVSILWLMVILTFCQVCLRGLYTHAQFQWANSLMGHLDWSEPFVRLLVLWVTFLGASLVTKDNKHIKIDLFSTALPPKLLPFRELVLSIFCMSICAVMVKVSLEYLKIEIEFGDVIFLQIPSWIGQLIIPAGFALIFFRFFIRAMNQAARVLKGESR